MRNLAECTKLDGYFIGTCYDGKVIFNLLKNKVKGESINLYNDDVKIWEIRKDYDEDIINDDITSVGYKISVYQQSINNMFSEYLVNFDYLNRIMENYGFKLITRSEAQLFGLPEGSGLFGELFNIMEQEIKRNPSKKFVYGDAYKMTADEKKISFLNRYFVYKKIANINAEKVILEMNEEIELTEPRREKATIEVKAVKEKSTNVQKPRVKKLDKKIILSSGSEEEEKEEIIVLKPKVLKEGKEPKTKKLTKNKLLIIED
jgi:hypothetical protein